MGEGESDQLDEGGRPAVSLCEQLSREEMTESARDHSDSVNTNPPDSETDKERALTMSMVSNKDERYWTYEFKGT